MPFNQLPQHLRDLHAIQSTYAFYGMLPTGSSASPHPAGGCCPSVAVPIPSGTAALERAPRPVSPTSSTVYLVGGAEVVPFHLTDGKPTDVSSVPPAFGFAGALSPAPIRQPPAAFLVGDVGFASAGGLSAASPPRSPAPSGNPTSSTEFLVGGDSQEISTSDGGGGADVVSPPAAPVPRGLASPGDSVIGGGVVSWSTAPAQGPASEGDDGGDVVTTLDRHEPSPWPPDAPAGNASQELSANDGGGSVGVMSPSAAPALRGSSPPSGGDVDVGMVSRSAAPAPAAPQVETRGSASKDQAQPPA
jgi:hypothetical protein